MVYEPGFIYCRDIQTCLFFLGCNRYADADDPGSPANTF